MGDNQFMWRMFNPGAWGAIDVLVWVVAAVAVAAMVLLVVGGIYDGGSRQQVAEDQQRQSPLDLLKERYARGELSQEEFDRHRSTLTRAS